MRTCRCWVTALLLLALALVPTASVSTTVAAQTDISVAISAFNDGTMLSGTINDVSVPETTASQISGGLGTSTVLLHASVTGVLLDTDDEITKSIRLEAELIVVEAFVTVVKK